MKACTIFYAGQIIAEFDFFHELREYRIICGQEIYNGAYVYVPPQNNRQEREWFRMDTTPVLEQDVPLELKTWVLLL